MRLDARRGAALIVLILLVTPFQRAGGDEGLMALADVRPGIRGIGKTVIRGTQVETFDVEVLGVLRGSGPAGDLVLIRVFGPLIQRSGGIAAGMSGSPVSVGGRLLGGIGFGWSFSDHTLGLVTPIHDMLRVRSGRAVQGGAPAAYRLPAPLRLGERTIRRVAVVPPGAAGGRSSAADTLRFTPVGVPLLVTGIGPRGAEALRNILQPYGVMPIEGGGAGSLTLSVPLEPGSAMGVQLMRGDINLTAVGTVTYRRGASLFGFGHAFLNKGGVEYFLTPAVIHEVVRSVATPFKIGSPGAIAGVIREDRRAAVAGQAGGVPKTFAVRVQVRDADRQSETGMGVYVVRDPELGPGLALIGVLEAFDRALDRVGGGTAWLRTTLRGEGLSGAVTRTNAFYHSRDVAVGALRELPEALRLLFHNEFVRVQPIDLTIEAEVSRQRRTASIMEVVPQRARLHAGEVLTVAVQIRPFHGEPVTRLIEIPIPEDAPAGQATLIVRGGSQGGAEQALLNLLQAETGESLARSLGEQIAGFQDRDQNTQVVVELVSPRPAGERGLIRLRVREGTPWVMRGRQQFTITVER